MNRSGKITKAIPLLLGIGFLLSACGTAPGYGAVDYPYGYNGYVGYPYDPIYSSLDFGFGGFHHDRDFHHGPDGHMFGQHGGHGFARVGGHGFAGRGGFGGHGGGGHR